MLLLACFGVFLCRSCAMLAAEAGYDGVEVMGSEGYLINQFLVKHTNKRRERFWLLLQWLASMGTMGTLTFCWYSTLSTHISLPICFRASWTNQCRIP